MNLARVRGVATPLAMPFVTAVALLVIAALHLAAQSRAELEASDVALKRNDGVAAAVHARNAARAYVPGVSYSARAYERLRDMAEMGERKGDIEAALFAWRTLLSAAAGSRPFGAPCEDACQRAETSVARLTAAVVRASARTAPLGRRAPNLEDPPEAPLGLLPGAGSGLLVVAGAVLTWVAGVRMARALDGGHRAPPLRAAAGLALAGVVMWVAGLFVA